MKKTRVNQWLLFTPLLFFGVGGVYFLVSFLRGNSAGAFQSNLVPELIGFCLEGFFLVGLFSLIQRRQERDRKEELRQSLRGALRVILSHLDIAMLDQYAEPANSQLLDHDPRVVATLIVKLSEVQLELEDMRKMELQNRTSQERNRQTLSLNEVSIIILKTIFYPQYLVISELEKTMS